jgi:tRNA pseudouridine38-40 synthase
MSAQTERLELLIAYDGRPFRGWQSQATGDAVQDHVEQAFAGVLEGRTIVHGAGRTDAGVHALGQVAHADVATGRLPLQQWQRVLNANLPPEIRILRVSEARPDFHARFDARGKVYAYRIWNGSYLHPLEIGRAWLVPGKIDFDVLRRGADLAVGTHDFAGFAARMPEPGENTVRTIHSIDIARENEIVTVRFFGDGFLYKMVRMLCGSLVRCARQRAPEDWIAQLVAKKGQLKTHFGAPAEGLYLQQVVY